MTDTSWQAGSAFRGELANSVSHGVGLLLAVAAVPILVVSSVGRGAGAIVGAALFGSTLVVLYFTSTLYHAWPQGDGKRRLRVLDHSAIYLLIAGTYTPFTLGVLRGGLGWTLFGIIWGLALVGVTLKALGGVRYRVLSLALYLGMGWLVVIAIKPLWALLPTAALVWLIIGGIAYTAGVPFYVTRRLRYGHGVWHLFVIGGSICHFFAVVYAG